MRRRTFVISILIGWITWACICSTSWAVPHTIGYQGKVTNSAGLPLNGTYTMGFSLYDVDTGGTAFWQEEQSVNVVQGIYNVRLGSTMFGPLDYHYFSSDRVYLEVAIFNPDSFTWETLSPRQTLSSVPFAMNADALDGYDSSDFLHAGGSVTGDVMINGTLSLGASFDFMFEPEKGRKFALWDGVDDFYGLGMRWGTLTFLTHDTEKMCLDASGNLGLGTQLPEFRLDIVGNALRLRDSTDTESPKTLSLHNMGSAVDVIADNADLFLHSSTGNTILQAFRGKVGIGTGTPDYLLTVSSDIAPAMSVLHEGSNNLVHLGGSASALKAQASDGAKGVLAESTTNIAVHGKSNSAGVVGTHLISGNYAELGRSTDGLHAVAFGEDCEAIFAQSTLGHGVFSTSADADSYGVYGLNTSSGNKGFLGGAYGVYGESSGAYAGAFKGRVGIFHSTSGALVLEMGDGLDYAEGFDFSDKESIAPGCVVIIDSDHPGRLALSRQAYDTRVAGIVAGAQSLGSGVRLGAGQFDHDVALAGRVYCKVDARRSAVRPGDLLTTSDLPGHAMKAEDGARTHGAILGKAMDSLEQGRTGQVLVLVSLQ